MAIVFVLIPAGFIGGFLLGLLGTRIAHATECAYFWKAAGLSILLGQVALFGIAALSFVTMPRPLALSDQGVALQVEVRLPMAMISRRSPEPDGIRMGLYSR